MRHASRIDANHGEIKKAFMQAGCSVQDLHKVGGGCPDLLVGVGSTNVLIEVKVPERRKERRGGLENNQVDFFNAWRGPKAVVYSVADVVELVNKFRRGDATKDWA